MKKVSFFADFGSPKRDYTGGYCLAGHLLKILRSLPVDLTVFSAVSKATDGGASYVAGSDKDVMEVNLPSFRFGTPLAGLSWAIRLGGLLKKMPAQDLYVFNQPVTFLSLLPKAPTVAMFHGSDYVRLSKLSVKHPRSLLYDLFWKKPFLNSVQKKLLEKRGGVPLFNSNETLDILGKDFNIDPEPLREYVTHLPIDTSHYRFDADERKRIREQYEIAEGEVVVIAMYHMHPIKRPDRLASVIRRVVSSSSGKVRFMFTGWGEAPGAIEELLKDEEVAQRCVRIGNVPHGDVHKFYSAADIALSTSDRESFGYFIAEGMSVGLPFVAYRGGAISELALDKKTGFVVGSEDEFMKSLEGLIVDKNLREQMGKAGRERMVGKFDVGVFKERFVEILNKKFQLFNST